MESNRVNDSVLNLSDDYQILCDQQYSDHDHSGSFELIAHQQQHLTSKQQQKTTHKIQYNQQKYQSDQESQDGIEFIENIHINQCGGDFYIVRTVCPTSLTPKKQCTLSQWDDTFQKLINKSRNTTNPSIIIPKQNSYHLDKELIQSKLKVLNSILSLPNNGTLHQAFERLIVKYSPGWAARGVNANEQKKINKYMNAIEIMLQDPELKVLPQQRRRITNWIAQILLQYTQIDIQVSYSKGMQFLVLGITLCQVSPQLQKIKETFSFLMLGTHSLRRMYLPGSPLFFIQLKFLQQTIKEQLPKLYHKMIETAKTEKLFISVYKTMFLYKIVNRKIFQTIINLLIIYGIRILSITLFCALRSREEDLLEKIDENTQKAWQYVAKKLIPDYLSNQNIEQYLLKELGRTIIEDGNKWPA